MNKDKEKRDMGERKSKTGGDRGNNGRKEQREEEE